LRVATTTLIAALLGFGRLDMGMYCIQIKRGSKRLKEPLTHLNQNMIGCGMLTRLIRFLRRIYYGLLMAWEDYVLLALIILAIWMRLPALPTIVDLGHFNPAR
jgi:hypothetical protein